MFLGTENINFWLSTGSIIFLVFLSAFFTCSETALFSLSRLEQLKLKENPRSSCRLAVRMLTTPNKLLTTILIGNEFSDILSSSIATVFFIKVFGLKGELFAYPLMCLILFLFGDLFPKVLGFKHRQKMACLLAPALKVWIFIFTPIRTLMLGLVHFMWNLLGIPSSQERLFCEEELLHLIEEGYKAGLLGEHERKFIYGLFDSEQTPVSAIMTPRREIFALEDSLIKEEILQKIKAKGISQIPIYHKNLDNIIGVLHVKDLLRWRLNKKNFRYLRELTRPPFFIPEMMKVRTLLEEFQKRRIKIALVVDEYGTLVGLVTLEDVLEELFGEIYDEFDKKEFPIKEVASGIYLLSPKVRVDEFNRILKANLPSHEFETMGGFLLSLFGEVPEEGSAKEAFGFKFIAEKVKGHHIKLIRVEKIS